MAINNQLFLLFYLRIGIKISRTIMIKLSENNNKLFLINAHYLNLLNDPFTEIKIKFHQ